MKVGDLCAGDVIRTGNRHADKSFRRVSRVWASFVHAPDVVVLSNGCRLTSGHPVLCEVTSEWCRAGALRPAATCIPQVVYGIELEGHVDTVLVGGFVCAGIGVYCGPEFGWNIFTRKSTRCDARPGSCAKCDVAVCEKIDFAHVSSADMSVRYAPY